MIKEMTKAEIVKAINEYPGPKVTTRGRKDTLLEILGQRIAMTKPVLTEPCVVKESLLERFWSKVFG